MNQIFSPSRFIKYAAYQYRMRSKILLLTVAGAFIALSFLIFFMFMTNNYRWDSRSWTPLFFLTGALSALIYIGNSFPYFRKKDTTVSMIMLPASVFEKFVYEYMVRVVLFTLFYPLFFYLTAHIAVPIIQFIFSDREMASFSFDNVFIEVVKKEAHIFLYYVVPALYILAASLFFAGAVIARRHPLIKTLVAIGVVVLSVTGYFYFIVEEMGLKYGIGYVIENLWIKSEESALKTLLVFIIFAIITTLTYTYFKIKEKEV